MATPIFFFNYNTFKRINRCLKEENGQFSSHNTDRRPGGDIAAARSLKSFVIEEENGVPFLCG